MEKIKIAVVGVGNIAKMHIKSYLALPNVELYAFCDINEERLTYMGKQYGVTRLYTDEAKMLEELPEIDAVSVCTWNCAHAPCTVMALNAGKHVLCEKPMAMSAEEALAMKEAAERNGKLLMIGFVRRFGADCKTVKNLVAGNKLGDVYYAKASYLRRNGAPGGWFGDKARSGGGPLIDLGVHVIDLVRYLMDKPQAVSVYGSTFSKLGNRPCVRTKKEYVSSTTSKKDSFDCEDLALAMIRFENGATLYIETSFSLNIGENENSVELFGSCGGVKLAKETTYYGEMDGYLTDVKFDYPTKFDFDRAFEGEIAHFVDCISGKESRCITPAEDGIALMRILDAVYKSAETGHEVLIPNIK